MTTTTAEALLRLLTWLSPAFPTGGFAYSHGIEWAVQEGDIIDEASLGAWLADTLRFGAARSDAILLRHSYRAQDVAALEQIADLAAASATSRERQLETLAQGAAFCRAAAAWPSVPLDVLQERCGDRIAYPVAVGVLASSYDIGEDAACQGFLHALMANLISAGVRLIPLGQSAGLRVLAGLEAPIQRIATQTSSATLDDIGGACLRADIGAMRHETQYTRLFRS